MVENIVTVRTVSGKEFEVHSKQVDAFMVDFVQNKNADSFDIFLGDTKYITLFRNGLESITVEPLARDGVLGGKTRVVEGGIVEGEIFGRPYSAHVTTAQYKALENFKVFLEVDGYAISDSKHSWLFGAIIEQMPPSRRGTYHKDDIIAAAEYYTVYSNRIDDNASQFK
jgi:hypothetical protein